jgi:putative SOS response-associated peptidase YedK
MCGRYALTTPSGVLAALYRLANKLDYEPRYNVAPTQIVPVIMQGSGGGGEEPGGREIVPMRWGLIPSWAKDPSIGSRMINARSESAAEKPAFRQAFRLRRCVVPASGFYEWRKLGAKKQPYFIARADGQPLSLAGLWEMWTDHASGKEVKTFTILTTNANDMLRPLHDRMPVVLEPEECDRWLDPEEGDAGKLSAMLKPAADGVLAVHPVSPRVNSPANDDPLLVEPIQPSPVKGDVQGGLFD